MARGGRVPSRRRVARRCRVTCTCSRAVRRSRGMRRRRPMRRRRIMRRRALSRCAFCWRARLRFILVLPQHQAGNCHHQQKDSTLSQSLSIFPITIHRGLLAIETSLEFHKLVLIARSSVHGRKLTRRWIKPKDWKKVLQTRNFIFSSECVPAVRNRKNVIRSYSLAQ